jgi:ferredoxin
MLVDQRFSRALAVAPGRARQGFEMFAAGSDELVRDAAASCPSEAISLVDVGTGQPVDLD